MKELEKTKRISISAVLFLLIIIIGFLTYKKPKYIFKNSAETTLKEIVKKDYIVSADQLKSLNSSDYVLVDVRSVYDYDKGHIKDAVNIPLAQILTDDSSAFIDNMMNENKTVILYGEDPDEASSAWILLYQLGYENIKILSVKPRFEDNKLYVDNVTIEKPAMNFAEVMKKATSSSGIAKKTKLAKADKSKAAKKVIIVKKKKKRVPEGGC